MSITILDKSFASLYDKFGIDNFYRKNPTQKNGWTGFFSFSKEKDEHCITKR